MESPLRSRATALRSAVADAGGVGGVGGARGPLLGEGCKAAAGAASESARRGGLHCIASARSEVVVGGRGATEEGEEGVGVCFSSQLRVRSSARVAMDAAKPAPVAAPVEGAVRPVAAAVAAVAVAVVAARRVEAVALAVAGRPAVAVAAPFFPVRPLYAPMPGARGRGAYSLPQAEQSLP